MIDERAFKAAIDAYGSTLTYRTCLDGEGYVEAARAIIKAYESAKEQPEAQGDVVAIIEAELRRGLSMAESGYDVSCTKIAQVIANALPKQQPCALREALESVIDTIEMDYMVDGKWVDAPCSAITVCHRVATMALRQALAEQPKTESKVESTEGK
jgi:hypothetical protein